MKFVILFLISFGVFAAPPVIDPLIEIRYCGDQVRHSEVVRAFRKIHPCPSTGLYVGACPGHQINHMWPIDKGGCDAVWNMWWMPTLIKTSPLIGIDRIELKTTCDTPPDRLCTFPVPTGYPEGYKLTCPDRELANCRFVKTQ